MRSAVLLRLTFALALAAALLSLFWARPWEADGGEALSGAPSEELKGDSEADDRLFFALKIELAGRLVARPNLLGEAGRRLSVKMVDPERADHVNLSLQMLPVPSASQPRSYDISLTLQMPDIADSPETAEIHLCHGEEKRLLLSLGRLPLTVTIALLSVDSPEFEAWKELVEKEAAAQAT